MPFSSQSTWEFVVAEALSSCAAQGIDFCAESSCYNVCQIESILNHQAVVNSSDHVARAIKLNYLRLLLKLNQSQIDLLSMPEHEEVINTSFQFFFYDDVDLCEHINLFSGLDTPEDVPQEQEINNGIEILGYEAVQNCIGTPIGENTPRGNVEDLDYGFNGDATGIYYNWTSNENLLFFTMNNLFNLCTINDNQLGTIADE
ncbi:MAG: hypothetical protein WAS72_09895 [Saprospiraceae bacterium]